MNNEAIRSLTELRADLPWEHVSFDIQPKCGTYCIYDAVSNKAYIGSSTNCKSRINDHKRLLRRGVHCTKKLQQAFYNKGLNCFVLRYFESYDAAKLLEAHFSSKLGKENLLNHNMPHGSVLVSNASADFLMLCEELLYDTSGFYNGVIGAALKQA